MSVCVVLDSSAFSFFSAPEKWRGVTDLISLHLADEARSCVSGKAEVGQIAAAEAKKRKLEKETVKREINEEIQGILKTIGNCRMDQLTATYRAVLCCDVL